jgi:copper chaperone
MKKQFVKCLLLMVVAAFISACGGSISEDKKSSATDDLTSEKNLVSIELAVGGMTCSGCEVAIVGAVSKIQGVKMVDAYHMEGIAAITYDSSKVDIEKIKQVIEDSGYSAGDFEIIEPEQ